MLVAAVVAAAVVAWASGGSGRASTGRTSQPSLSPTGTGTGQSTAASVGSHTSTPPTTPAHRKAPQARPPYPVGTAALTLTDGARSLPTLLWYPASHAGQGAAGRRRPGGWPLIVFSQGFAIAPQAYSDLLASWAAGGFVVAAPSYPFTSPGVAGGLNRADIVNHPADLRAVVAELIADGSSASPDPLLAGMVEDRVGLAGHSDGGDVTDAAIANSCCRINGVVAAEVLSGAELTWFGGSYGTGPAIPLLVVQGDQDTINPPACSKQIYDAAPAPKYYLDLIGAGHHDPYLNPAVAAAYPDPNPSEAPVYRQIVARTTLAFWDRYLAKGAHGASLQAGANVAGVSSFTAGPAVPIVGTCPGAPPG